MTSFDQNQPPACPPLSTGGAPYLTPPPPVAYPTKDGHGGHHHPIQTNSKSDHGFWKACCFALCSGCDQGVAIRIIMSYLYKPKYDRLVSIDSNTTH
ncbi:hypothetical protein Q3G72_020454 [Acer saccharum]|nr:hypothetical protein Q3G72_020454 [Acer saccharum]